MNQKNYIGNGSIDNLIDILKKYKPNKIFLVTGKSSYETSGAKSKMEDLLKGYDKTIFDDFEINPKLNDIEKGVEFYREDRYDFVIAIGGGSAIDVAKTVNAFAVNPVSVEEYIKNEKVLEKKGNPLVAIPTTAGSGSEATNFSVVYIGKTKYSLIHDFLLPDYAIVDAQFTTSLPKYQTASTGMDVLGQAIESYWSVNSNGESKKYSSEAIELSVKYLADAVNNPTKVSREAMSKAAHLAGKAINIAKTTAPHAISYPITSYFNVSHGHAVGLTLAKMLEFNSKVTEEELSDKRGVEYVKNTINEIVDLVGAKNISEASKEIDELMDNIGLERSLGKLGIKTDQDIQTIIKNGFNPQRVKNNPRKLTEDSLKKILYQIK